MNIIGIIIAVEIIAVMNRFWNIWLLALSLLKISESSTNKPGIKYPIEFPKIFAFTAIAVAQTLSFSPNQLADTFPGAFIMNG